MNDPIRGRLFAKAPSSRGCPTRQAAIGKDLGRDLPASWEHPALAMARPESFPALPVSSAPGACQVTPALALHLAPAWTQQLLSYGSQSYPLDLRPTLGRPAPICLRQIREPTRRSYHSLEGRGDQRTSMFPSTQAGETRTRS